MCKIKIILGVALVLALTGCNAKKSEQEKSVQKPAELKSLSKDEGAKKEGNKEPEKKADEIVNLSTEEISKFVADYHLNDAERFVNHKIDYTLVFDYSGGYDTKVYADLYEKMLVYIIQKDDKIYVSNIVHVIATGKTFIKIKMDSGMEGFINLGRNPYKDGDYEVVDSMEVDGKKINLLKLEDKYVIDNKTGLYEKPSEKSKKICDAYVEKFNGYNPSSLITEDYKWVKMSFETDDGTVTGWIKASCLGQDRGGPTFYTPEATIFWELIGANEI